MPRTHTVVRGALLLGATAIVAGCNGDNGVVAVQTVDPLFTNYVALGNSITAGYQSGGINDSTQRQSYAYLLAHQMGTRFAYPSFASPGCPPPVNNLLTQSRVGGATSTSTTCTQRGVATPTLNNVAVPGITSLDPVAAGGTAGAQNTNPLVQLILGGNTMVQKALENQPTFATVWVGNNDILAPALNGLPAGAAGVVGPATTVQTFAANYAKDINALVAGAPKIKGVLIGVIQVAGAPIMFQAGLLANPTVAAAAAQVAGRPVVLDPTTCAPPNDQALVNFAYLAAIRSRPAAAPGAVFCQKVAGGGAVDPGDNGILDVTEQASVLATINGYNAYIKAKADSIGFAYYDPNPLLASLHANGSIPPFPNLTSSTAPFGQYVSLDGIHPAAAAHVAVANQLIALINSTYKTSIPTIPQ